MGESGSSCARGLDLLLCVITEPNPLPKALAGPHWPCSVLTSSDQLSAGCLPRMLCAQKIVLPAHVVAGIRQDKAG